MAKDTNPSKSRRVAGKPIATTHSVLMSSRSQQEKKKIKCKKENSFFEKSCDELSRRGAHNATMDKKETEKLAGNNVNNLLSPIEAVDQPDNFSILKAGGMVYWRDKLSDVDTELLLLD